MARSQKIICTVINDLTYDQRMHRICSVLAEAGYDVMLLGRMKGKSVPLTEQPFQQKRIVCMSDSGVLMYMEFNIRLFLYLLFHKFDIVNAVDLDTIMPASIVSRLQSKTMVYDAHELFTEVPEIVGRSYLRKFWTWVEETFVPKAKVSYTVGDSLANIFSEKYQQDFAVIRNVPFRNVPEIELDKKIGALEESSSTEEKIILYQGAVNAGRGLKEMIAAMPLLDERIKLWIIGDGDLYEQIKEAAEASSASGRIKIWGYMKPVDMQELTRKAWIGINLLENTGLSYYYSLANRTFDFIQAGVPAIHIDFPEYRSINDKYQIGVLVENMAPETIAKAVASLQEETFYNTIKQNCETAAAELCWEKEKGKLIEIYDNIA